MLARAIASTGLNRVVFVFLQQRPLHRRPGLVSHHLSTKRNALPRRCCQMTARADGLTVTALDTRIGNMLDQIVT
jgi:hypothetical protein